MPITRVETIGRTLDTTSITRTYYIHGPADESEVLGNLAASVPFLAGLPLADFAAEEESEIAGDWRATVTWGVTPLPEQPLDTVEYRFNFTAPSAHITQSLDTILYSTPLGSDPDPAMVGAPNFDGAINVVIDGGKKRVEGFDLAPPPEVFTLTFATESGFITRDYQRIVEKMCGKVNIADYYDVPAGNLLLARVSGGKNAQNAWSIEFGFSYVSHGDNIAVGDQIEVSHKDGHDLLWIFYGDSEDTNYYDVIPRPVAAYVERIWPREDFALLALPL